MIIRRTFSIIGILGALVAAQGLFHLGASVVAFGQGDPQFFMTMLIVPLIGAGILLLDLLNKSFKKIKWVMVALLLMCMVLMSKKNQHFERRLNVATFYRFLFICRLVLSQWKVAAVPITGPEN